MENRKRLEEKAEFRLFGDEKAKVKAIVTLSDNYENESHFYRCAVIKLIAECTDSKGNIGVSPSKVRFNHGSK